uniref:AWS domain-containing protein n=1 Tax=Globodera pallida TaxID=36090 RepID=A0A183BJF0_GLOPA
MLARHSEPRGYACIQSLRYEDDYKKKLYAIIPFLRDKWGWEDINEYNANGWMSSPECYLDVSCETYRCKNEKGNDIFVVNACAKEKIKDAKSTKCTNHHDQMIQFCDNPVCSQCYGKRCNENRKDLEVTEVVTKKPPEETTKSSTRTTTTQKVNPKIPTMATEECTLTFRYADDYELPRALKELMVKTMGVNINKPGRGLKCNNATLDKFCPAPWKSTCVFCKGEKCNKKDIPLEMGSEGPPPLTTTTPETTVSVDFGEGSKTGLLCVLHKICNVEKNGNAKLSRRFFVVNSLKKSEKCKELSKKLKTVQEQDHVQELGDDLSESIQKVGLVFVDDYILAIEKIE